MSGKSSVYGYILIMIAIIMFIIGAVNFRHIKNLEKNGIEIKAEIIDYFYKGHAGTTIRTGVDMDREFSLLIKYKVEDKTYTKTLNAKRIKYPNRGDYAIIHYNPNNPNDILEENRNAFIITILIGMFFMILGIKILKNQ